MAFGADDDVCGGGGDADDDVFGGGGDADDDVCGGGGDSDDDVCAARNMSKHVKIIKLYVCSLQHYERSIRRRAITAS